MTTKTKPTERQLELLAFMCSGLSIADAAKKQFITDRSAYNVIRNVRTKVGASSNEHLVVIALTEGWLKVADDGKVTVAGVFNI